MIVAEVLKPALYHFFSMRNNRLPEELFESTKCNASIRGAEFIQYLSFEFLLCDWFIDAFIEAFELVEG